MSDSGKPVVIIGFGGHGRVVAASLRAIQREIIAATDFEPETHLNNSFGIRVLRDEELLQSFDPDSVELAMGVGSIAPVGREGNRRTIVAKFLDAGYRFTGFHHPHAWVCPESFVSPTAQIHAGAIVQPGVAVGDHAIINTNASIDHDSRIGEFCHVGPGVTLSGGVQIGPGSHIGTGASIIQNIELGRECFVAAGAVVVKGVADGEFVRGVPARSYEVAGN